METQTKPQPVKQFRVAGITASVWQREHDGKTFHSVSLDRSFKSDGKWRRTSSFSPEELPIVIDLAHRAYEYLATLTA